GAVEEARGRPARPTLALATSHPQGSRCGKSHIPTCPHALGPLFGYAVQIDGGSTLRSNFRGVGNFHLSPLNQAIVDDTTADLLKLSLHFDSGRDAMTVVSTDISPRQARDLAIHLWLGADRAERSR